MSILIAKYTFRSLEGYGDHVEGGCSTEFYYDVSANVERQSERRREDYQKYLTRKHVVTDQTGTGICASVWRSVRLIMKR